MQKKNMFYNDIYILPLNMNFNAVFSISFFQRFWLVEKALVVECHNGTFTKILQVTGEYHYDTLGSERVKEAGSYCCLQNFIN